MLLLRCLRPDKLPEAIQQFISTHLGRRFIEPPPWDLTAQFNSSSPLTPLIILLSPGANPTEEIFKLANSIGMKKRVQSISFGQQQGPIAEKSYPRSNISRQLGSFAKLPFSIFMDAYSRKSGKWHQQRFCSS